MIVGIGVDIAEISRVEEALRRTPALAGRLFAQGERNGSAASLAGSFAAKEAVAKVLGAPSGLRWTDVEVVRSAVGRPSLQVSGTVADAAASLGIRRWHLSLSHDGRMCVAMVVAEA